MLHLTDQLTTSAYAAVASTQDSGPISRNRTSPRATSIAASAALPANGNPISALVIRSSRFCRRRAATVVGSRCGRLLVGACEWQFQEVRDCLPETPSYMSVPDGIFQACEPLTRFVAAVVTAAVAPACSVIARSVAHADPGHDGDRVKKLFNFKGAVVISLS